MVNRLRRLLPGLVFSAALTGLAQTFMLVFLALPLAAVFTEALRKGRQHWLRRARDSWRCELLQTHAHGDRSISMPISPISPISPRARRGVYRRS